MPSRSSPSANPRKAGIVQIAEHLGVSPSTVSRALRTETAHLVRADVRKAILDLAEKQNFSPNPGARMLRKGGSNTITVVVPLDENIFFSEYYGRFLAGILHAASARGWGVHISTLQRKPGAGLREAMQHVSLNSSGVIYLGEPITKSDLQELKGFRRPLVFTKSALPTEVPVAEAGLPVVGVDNYAGARSVAMLLLQLGHRRIALLLGPDGSRDAVERKRGYLDALEQAGVKPKPEWVFAGPFSADTGRRGFASLLKSQRRPTAICCANDEIAFGALHEATIAGIRCPEDVSVVGFDDGMWAAACHPALTTVRQPLTDMAERAVGLIGEASKGGGKGPRVVLDDMSAPMMIRDSTRALRNGE
ncbi:MAG: LacI family DNA-binding transcriptional regulator [Opitutaceae bacterium]